MKTLSENRRARFDYDILETVEAGIELTGPEVKSAKAGHMNISGSYVVIRGGEAWLLNSGIPPYQPKNMPEEYDPSRSRRLLLKKEEINSLAGKIKEKTVTLLPLKSYVKKGYIKLELGLGRGMKKSDKREVLKKKDIEREIQRKL